MKKILAILALVVVLGVIAIALEEVSKHVKPPVTAPVSQTGIKVSYACANGKAITAAFIEGSSTPSTDPNGPPTPGGTVALALSDNRALTLPQVISADGGRYANSDESFVFWAKGNGAFILENNQQTYMGCIVVADDPGGLSQVFESGSEGFSLRYPADYTVTDPYTYEALGPNEGIGGVKFTVPSTLTTGTNLSSDTYVSVESMKVAAGATCSASSFLQPGSAVANVTDGDTTYSVGTNSDAAAGNRYEEKVYAIPGTSPCVAIRYFIHSGAIENYPAGSTKAFDEAALMKEFDAIRHTLVISQ